MNENENEKYSLLLFVARFGFWGVFPFAVHCFCCFSLLFLVFEIESVLPQKPKQANTFDCSFWLFVARFGFGACFHLAAVAFCCSSLLVSQKPKQAKFICL